MQHPHHPCQNASIPFGIQFSGENRPLFRAKDPISALTHFIACIASVLAMPWLLIEASEHLHDRLSLLSVSVFMLSMVFLYGASTAYHTFRLSAESEKVLRKLDHAMIYVLIAGSYTPICFLALREAGGTELLGAVWLITVAGICLTMFWVHCPKWVSSSIYIGMGWLCLTAFSGILHSLPIASFLWLLIGGVLYTAGGVIYALRLPLFPKTPGFGAHELFHLFVMAGSFCHYICVFLLLRSI